MDSSTVDIAAAAELKNRQFSNSRRRTMQNGFHLTSASVGREIGNPEIRLAFVRRMGRVKA